jgi:hypothetical protein
MSAAGFLDESASDRDLIRRLRRGADAPQVGVLPESEAWQVYLELRRRHVPDAEPAFMAALRQLHARRAMGASLGPLDDQMTEEHRLVEADNPFLADLWKSYKRCIQQNRTGPAGLLLRDIEEQLTKVAR